MQDDVIFTPRFQELSVKNRIFRSILKADSTTTMGQAPRAHKLGREVCARWRRAISLHLFRRHSRKNSAQYATIDKDEDDSVLARTGSVAPIRLQVHIAVSTRPPTGHRRRRESRRRR